MYVCLDEGCLFKTNVVFASAASTVQLLICVAAEMQQFGMICCILAIAKENTRESLYLFSSLVRGEVPQLTMGAQLWPISVHSEVTRT